MQNGRRPTLIHGGRRGRPVRDNWAKSGKKVAALVRMAAMTSGEGVDSQPENSRELPSRRLPVADVVAVKVTAAPASSAGMSTGAAE